jgi:hypothetical protein
MSTSELWTSMRRPDGLTIAPWTSGGDSGSRNRSERIQYEWGLTP